LERKLPLIEAAKQQKMGLGRTWKNIELYCEHAENSYGHYPHIEYIDKM
jgi:hypothetical protein